MNKIDVSKDSIQIKFNYVNVFWTAIIFTAGHLLYMSFFTVSIKLIDYFIFK